LVSISDVCILLTAAEGSDTEPQSPVDDTVDAEKQPGVKRGRKEKVTEEFKKVEVDINLQGVKTVKVMEVPVPTQPEAPKFIKKLEPKEIFETMPVKLECAATGFPEPSITWFMVSFTFQSWLLMFKKHIYKADRYE